MDHKIKKHKKSNSNKYKKDELDIALEFSKQAKKEFDDLLKGIVLFGSNARDISGTNQDIDILILLDDVGTELTKEVVEAYHIVSTKLVAKISPRIHVTTFKFTTFWDFVMKGDPIGINILRDGIALIDTGFFDPLQALLLRGKISPSYESVWIHMNRAHVTLNQTRERLIDATLGLYWAVIDSAQAALMRVNIIPPSPDKTYLFMDKHLVSKKLCSKKYVEIMKEFYGIYKEITHRKIEDISGGEYERYYAKAKDFVSKMKSIVEQL